MYILTAAEKVMEDNDMVYTGLAYIADNKFIRSEVIASVTIFKQRYGYSEIRICDMHAHHGAKIGDYIYSSYFKI